MPLFIESYNINIWAVLVINPPPDYYVREISTDIFLHIKIHTAVLKYIRLDVAYMGACLRTITVQDFRLKMRPP